MVVIKELKCAEINKMIQSLNVSSVVVRTYYILQTALFCYLSNNVRY